MSHSHRKTPLFVLLVIISIFVPLLLAGWSFHRFRMTSLVNMYSEGSLQNGELLYPEYQFPNGQWASPFVCRIKSRDVKTGIERDTGLAANDEFLSLKRVGDTLFVVTDSTIYRAQDSSLIAIGTVPLPRSSTFEASIFVAGDQWTTVLETNENEFRLVHLKDGVWTNGRKIRLPGLDVDWADECFDDRRVLRPSIPSGLNHHLQIEQFGQQVHLYYEAGNFRAYRTGFEYVDETETSVSALSPENTGDPHGWEPFVQKNPGWQYSCALKCDRHGELLVSDAIEIIYRRSSNGSWTRIAEQPEWLPSAILVDTADGTAYDVRGSGQVDRIGVDSLEPAGFSVPDQNGSVDHRWALLTRGLLIAWIVHVVIFIVGTQFLTRADALHHYEFGMQSAVIASVARRSLAFTIDALLLMSIFAASVYVHVWLLDIKWQRIELDQFNQLLMELDNEVLGLFINGLQGIDAIVENVKQLVILCIGENEGEIDSSLFNLISMVGIDTVFVIWFLKLLDEGRYGVTPGKWLLGIRTVRSTLRPCGFARCLMRDAFWLIDFLLLTPIPAAFSLVFSSHVQRWGDRVADTVVVRASSIQVSERQTATAE